MFRCIYGQPVSIGFRRGNTQNNYDIDWNPLTPIRIKDIEKPEHLDKMIRFAKLLSAQFEFVRIDFYYVNQNIYFGEFTFTPSGGNPFFPIDIENKLGTIWT